MAPSMKILENGSSGKGKRYRFFEFAQTQTWK